MVKEMKKFKVINSTGKLISEIEAEGFKQEESGVIHFYDQTKVWVASVPGTIFMITQDK